MRHSQPHGLSRAIDRSREAACIGPAAAGASGLATVAQSPEIVAVFVQRLSDARANGDYSADIEATYQAKYRALFQALVSDLNMYGPGAVRTSLCNMILHLDRKHCGSGSYAYSVVSEKIENHVGYSFRFLNGADRDVIAHHFLNLDNVLPEEFP